MLIDHDRHDAAGKRRRDMAASHVDLGQANGRDGLLRLGFGNFQFKRADGIEFGEFFVVLEGFVFGLMLGQGPR